MLPQDPSCASMNCQHSHISPCPWKPFVYYTNDLYQLMTCGLSPVILQKEKIKNNAFYNCSLAHQAHLHVCLAASMNPDAHVRCMSPPHSVPSPGAMLCSMASNPGYLNDAACTVHGWHPRGHATLSTGLGPKPSYSRPYLLMLHGN